MRRWGTDVLEQFGHWGIGALVRVRVTCWPLSQTSQSLEKARTGSSVSATSDSRPTWHIGHWSLVDIGP